MKFFALSLLFLGTASAFVAPSSLLRSATGLGSVKNGELRLGVNLVSADPRAEAATEKSLPPSVLSLSLQSSGANSSGMRLCRERRADREHLAREGDDLQLRHEP